MRSMMMMKWDGVTPDQYEKIRKIVNWEGNTPKGAVFHVSGFNKNALRVTDIWESEVDFNDFVQDRLMPAVAQAGISGKPKVKVFPVHATYVPDVRLLSK